MKWIPQDIETFLNAKEYIDTAVIPLVPLSFEEDVKQSAEMSEFITLLTGYIERQFTGRIVLLPSFTYLTHKNMDFLLTELTNWKSSVEQGGFKHIFYVTSDIGWKEYEDILGPSLLWIPSIPLEKMEEMQKWIIVESQGKQLLNLFSRKWRENE
ncbi:MAG: YpiF family protein [Bacillota bacterium]|nr:YpiF family protein [Bacillota bacterium]